MWRKKEKDFRSNKKCYGTPEEDGKKIVAVYVRQGAEPAPPFLQNRINFLLENNVVVVVLWNSFPSLDIIYY